MKFWRQILLTTLVFFSIGSMTLYISCEKDQCSATQCQNGGNCIAGICQCALGWEDAKCGTRSMDRYLGTYTGSTTNTGNINPGIAHLLDTVVITPGSDLVTVNISMRAYSPDMVTGTITNAENGYHIVVSPIINAGFTKTMNIDLQNNKLIIDKVIQYNAPIDSTSSQEFIGYK